MIDITHILCPIDFSETSRHALDHASALAKWYKARLTVLYVFVNRPVMDLPPLLITDADRERLMADMRRFTTAVPSDVVLDLHLEEALYVHDEVLSQVTSLGVDFLVLGTHGRSGIERVFIGSVTEKLIRKAACPTLVVPPRAPDVAADVPVQFRRILCPIDFSDSSLEALAYALNIAKEADGHLTLLHVVELPASLGDDPTAAEVDLQRVRAAAEVDSRRRLHELIPEGARTYCTVDTAVAHGKAYREVLRQAGERRSDLIVMGVHGRGALDLMVFGSTTHSVIRSAVCPVLIAGRT